MIGRFFELILLFFIPFFFTHSGFGTTLQVCPECDLKTIQEGINTASPHDTVLVKKATYLEYNIKVDRPLTIDGEDKGDITSIYSDSVTIDGLFIINVGTSYTTDHAAIRVVKSEYFDIKNVVLEKLFFGIYLEKSSYGDRKSVV